MRSHFHRNVFAPGSNLPFLLSALTEPPSHHQNPHIPLLQPFPRSHAVLTGQPRMCHHLPPRPHRCNPSHPLSASVGQQLWVLPISQH